MRNPRNPQCEIPLEKIEVVIGDIHLELPAVNLELCSDIDG